MDKPLAGTNPELIASLEKMIKAERGVLETLEDPMDAAYQKRAIFIHELCLQTSKTMSTESCRNVFLAQKAMAEADLKSEKGGGFLAQILLVEIRAWNQALFALGEVTS